MIKNLFRKRDEKRKKEIEFTKIYIVWLIDLVAAQNKTHRYLAIYLKNIELLKILVGERRTY